MSAEDQPRDHVPMDEDDSRTGTDIEGNIKSRSTWIRLIFMLIFFALYAVSRPVVLAVIALQFLWMLFTADKNKQLAMLGHSLALYTYEIIDYMTYNNEEKPFPFDSPWPSGDENRIENG